MWSGEASCWTIRELDTVLAVQPRTGVGPTADTCFLGVSGQGNVWMGTICFRGISNSWLTSKDLFLALLWTVVPLWLSSVPVETVAIQKWETRVFLVVEQWNNLVDSASSHTLVSKIKPCMSKYKCFTLNLRTAHYISYSLFDSPLLLG